MHVCLGDTFFLAQALQHVVPLSFFPHIRNRSLVLNLSSTFESNLWWYLLRQDFGALAMNHLHQTVRSHEVVEVDGIGMCLTKYHSFILRTFQVDPINCILMHFP